MREIPLHSVGTPVDESTESGPPIIRRTEMIAFALIGLLVIAIVAVLYIARTLLMPIAAAFIVGTMMSSGAAVLQRLGLPRSLSVTLTFGAAFGIVAVLAALLSAPLLQWSSELPQIGRQLRDKLHAFDRPIALWHELQAALGVAPSDVPLALPKLEWVQPTVEFVTPTITELLLFVVTLILFVASWPDLRRSLILVSSAHDKRLRSLRILNAIEEHLGSYLLTVSAINIGIGVVTGLIGAATGLPNPAGIGALAATLNYIPIIGPIVTFLVLVVLGIAVTPSLTAGLLPAALFAVSAFLEGHFITPTIIGRRLELNALAVFVAFSFWTWLWGPIGAVLASPMLIVGLVAKGHLLPDESPQFPED